MAASMSPYETWLSKKLLSLNPDTDTEIFVSYITGIIEEDSPEDEKRESVLDLIEQVVEENQTNVVDEIFKKWEEINGQMSETPSQQKSNELTEHLACILEKQKIEGVKQHEKTEEEIARKKAILAQYGHVSSGDEAESEEEYVDHTGTGDLLEFKNVNSEQVKMNEIEMREKSKQESDSKREKDKQDREAQKQKSKDRKEGEKKRTQKGERRR
ncbi:coiled-coil domain-containing protein 43-like [Mya arenaria]|uniref:coiled-coil domain-containing protein 43-like n=1 Tax=Mya arenaria TaxID=6604 RepID=UPI0022E634F7|nr:coiled-coil domain-containing protein 43-like [Mya arenaria]